MGRYIPRVSKRLEDYMGRIVVRKEKQQELIANCYRKRFNGNIILGAAIDNGMDGCPSRFSKTQPGLILIAG